ncbi:CENPO protein, partial [Bucco capensis]|nr:CENPO protein [Bucco capensis]
RGKMEEREVHSADGILGHLEALEAEAQEAAVKQEEQEQQQEKMARLQARVQELRLQRDELQAKVKLQQQGQLGEGGIVLDPGQPRAQAVLEWKIKSLKSLLEIFYLTGISAKRSKHGICFSISTAFEGTYLDSYHLELLIQPQVRIHHHSIPIFIPLEQLSKKYLQTNLRSFLALLSHHLNAYVGRRYQADQFQEHFAEQLEGSLQRNSLCNLLVFNYKVAREGKSFLLNARLLYRDPCSTLPSEAIVSCTAEASAALAEVAAAHSALYRQIPLHRAF